MESRITVADLAEHLREVLRRIHASGERIVVEEHGTTVATLVPEPPAPGIRPRVLAAALGELRLPGDGFADDLEALQVSQPCADLPEWPN